MVKVTYNNKIVSVLKPRMYIAGIFIAAKIYANHLKAVFTVLQKTQYFNVEMITIYIVDPQP